MSNNPNERNNNISADETQKKQVSYKNETSATTTDNNDAQQEQDLMMTTPTQQPQQRRQSQALGNVHICTLDDVKALDPSKMDKEIRVLVTVHSTKIFNCDVYTRGLGMWVAYIIQKYLKQRGIPHKFYMKSILTGSAQLMATTPKKLIHFLQHNQIDYLIPSDVTDTMFVAEHYQEIAEACGSSLKMAVTPNKLDLYQILEDKWATFNLCTSLGIDTPKTELFDRNQEHEHDFPFFLKAASGTNAGRGVWHCKNQDDLELALKAKEARKADVLLRQQPTYGEIICAEIIYNHGKPLGFFFAKSVQAEDLAGMGTAYVNSQKKEFKQKSSHVKVELTDEQWQTVTKIFQQIGEGTKYHGMIDIEFIVAGPGNAHAEEGSIWLLECNPRFSGDIHTTLSNPGFLDLYFQVMDGIEDDNDLPTTNYSVGVEMRSKFGDFAPLRFYQLHPFKILSLRHWRINNRHVYPKKKILKKNKQSVELSCCKDAKTETEQEATHNEEAY